MFLSQNNLVKGYIFGSTFLSVLIVFTFIWILGQQSSEAILKSGMGLFSLEWFPPENKFGILSMVYGSAAVTFIALIVAVPFGFFVAIYISEFLPSKYKIIVKSILEILAGIPSIVYGLIGISFITIWVGEIFYLQSGKTILSAGLILSIMVFPTIVTLMEDALQNVPQHYRESARGVGLYPYEVVFYSVLPLAKSGIIGTILLAFGRAIGETMAVMLVIGSIDKIPTPFLNILSPGQTITSKLGREIAESSFGSLHFSALVTMGFLLMLFVLLLTAISLKFFKAESRLDD